MAAFCCVIQGYYVAMKLVLCTVLYYQMLSIKFRAIPHITQLVKKKLENGNNDGG